MAGELVVRTSLAGALVVLLLGGSTASHAAAQSLAEVARQEEARRRTARPAARTYTNASLPPDSYPAAAAAPAAPTSVAASAPASTSEVATASRSGPAREAPSEPMWRQRAVEYRARTEAARKQLESLTGAEHQDPREQAMLEALRQRRQTALSLAEDAQRLFEMQADAARIPRAWIQ